MKKFIYTITPNPALDLSGVVKNLRPDEKSYVIDEKRAPGGNAINVSRILARLNIPTLASGFLGGSTGDEIESLLNKEDIHYLFFRVNDSSRINITISNSHNHRQTRLSFKGPQIPPSVKRKLFDDISRRKNISHLVFGGSLPPGFSFLDVKSLLRLAHKKAIPVFIDSPAELLRELISLRPFMIKQNLEEFQQLTNTHKKTIGTVQNEARKFLEKMPYICVSSVEGGTLLISRTETYFGRIPSIKIRSTVGAGDSLLAGIISQFYLGNTSTENLLRWGLASAAATLSHAGTELGHSQEIQNLFKKTLVHKVK